jgi:GT2 family glycosyltransferase
MISLVTLTHNKLNVTRRCLPTWLAARDVDLELIVVDNGSQDGTDAWLELFAEQCVAAGVELRAIKNTTNVGCSTARNQGIEAARGAYIAFLDNDVSLRMRDGFALLRDTLARHPECVMAGAKLVYPFAPYNIQCAGVGISRSGRVQFRGRGEPRDAAEFNHPREVQCMISACCIALTDAVRAAGGFDEAFNPVQFEDFDLCYKLREKGGTLRYEPKAEFYHFESTTTQGTTAIVNPEVVIRHGLLFKKRWRHMFSTEDGPPDSDTRWRVIPLPAFESIPDPPLVD